MFECSNDCTVAVLTKTNIDFFKEVAKIPQNGCDKNRSRVCILSLIPMKNRNFYYILIESSINGVEKNALKIRFEGFQFASMLDRKSSNPRRQMERFFFKNH